MQRAAHARLQREPFHVRKSETPFKVFSPRATSAYEKLKRDRQARDLNPVSVDDTYSVGACIRPIFTR